MNLFQTFIASLLIGFNCIFNFFNFVAVSLQRQTDSRFENSLSIHFFKRIGHIFFINLLFITQHYALENT